MKILFVGDVFAECGMRYVCRNLERIKKENGIDFCIANGENSTVVGKGTSRATAEDLFAAGADVITGGNHSFDNPEIVKLLREGYPIIRPANYPPFTEGEGYITRTCKGKSITVINLLGRIFMDNMDCPFRSLTHILKKVESDIIILDFHAEATSEKRAMGFYADGKISALIGTHTHVPTADETILPKGTAYISDAGMSGVKQSILGVKKEIIIKRLLSGLPQKFEPAEGEAELNGVILTLEENKVTAIERIRA